MRRPAFAALAALFIVTAPVPAVQAAPCGPPPAADTSTAEGWIGYLAQHRDQVSLVLDDGRGGALRHRAKTPMPTASMIKLVHLAALAGRAGTGAVDINERIPLAAWQRWYVPGPGGVPLDGAAHAQALKYLGIPAKDGVPLDMSGTVSLHQLADVMIRFSDSAAPDALRARLGDDTLRAVMDRYGFTGPIPSLQALYEGVLRDAAAHLSPARIGDATYSAPAAPFARLIRDLGTGRFGAGSDIARGFLEWQGAAPAGLAAFGFKGGSLTGTILTEAFEGRRSDGSVSTAVLMVHRMPTDAYRKDLEAGMPHQATLIRAMTDPAARERLACALRS